MAFLARSASRACSRQQFCVRPTQFNKPFQFSTPFRSMGGVAPTADPGFYRPDGTPFAPDPDYIPRAHFTVHCVEWDALQKAMETPKDTRDLGPQLAEAIQHEAAWDGVPAEVPEVTVKDLGDVYDYLKTRGLIPDEDLYVDLINTFANNDMPEREQELLAEATAAGYKIILKRDTSVR